MGIAAGEALAPAVISDEQRAPGELGLNTGSEFGICQVEVQVPRLLICFCVVITSTSVISSLKEKAVAVVLGNSLLQNDDLFGLMVS